MKHIEIDRTKCAGHGRCYTLAPAFFEPDDVGFPLILATDVADDAERLSVLSQAVDNCPERALSLVEKD